MRGLSRKSTIIFRPSLSNAKSTASKILYRFETFSIQFLNKYRPNKNAAIDPVEAPIKTDIVEKSSPRPKPNALAKTNPLPNVSIEPGINSTIFQEGILMKVRIEITLLSKPVTFKKPTVNHCLKLCLPVATK